MSVDNPAFDGWVKGRTPSRRWGRPDELVALVQAMDDVTARLRDEARIQELAYFDPNEARFDRDTHLEQIG